MITVLAYCQTAIRLGVSRGRAYQVWVDHHPAYPRRAFEARWKTAKTIESLFTPYSTIRPEVTTNDGDA